MSRSGFIRQLPRPQLTYANVCSTAALVLALGTGTAYAAATITSADIVDGEVKRPDIASQAVNSGKIAQQGVRAEDVLLGTLTGDQVADGALGSADLADNSVGSLEIQTDGVGATEIRPSSVDADELSDGGVTEADLGAGSVGASEVDDSSLTGADIANDGLSMSDIVGGGTTNGNVGFSPISNGRCLEVSLGINGGTAGDGVVITTKGDMPNGVFLYGTEVPAPGTAKAVICNMSGATSPQITDMPVRIHTFH